MITTPKDYYSLYHRIQSENAPSIAVLLPTDERIYKIDLNARTVEAPEYLSVEKDHRAETIYFTVNRFYDFFSSIEFHPTIFQQTGYFQVDSQGHPHMAGDSVGGLGILAALFGASAGNPFIKECLDFFGSRHFVRHDGSLFIENIIYFFSSIYGLF